jgi:3-oxoacyl-(acyl-carrier-protein) synthase
MNRIVITGIGTITPAGRGLDALWRHVQSGQSCLEPIDSEVYFDASAYACQVAGQVHTLHEPRVLTERMLAQTDRYSQLALVAVLDALETAQLPRGFLPVVQPERVSLVVGTAMAGLATIEKEMRTFWTQGKQGVDRYSETAGFPPSAQGHISIHFGVKGRSRTFVSERASGAHALIEGAKMIQRGLADVVIAGGAEAPITSIVWSAYQSSGMVARTSELEPAYTYRPFDSEHMGMIVGEGSTFLVLEEREHAEQRGVPILAEVCGWGMGTDPTPLHISQKAVQSPGQTFVRIISTSLDQAHIRSVDIDAIFAHGAALPQEDATERAAMTTVFGDYRVPVTIPKLGFGHLQGAAAATDVAIAVQSLLHHTIPPTPSAQYLEAVSGLDLVYTPVCTRELRQSMVLSGGLGGMQACLVVSSSGKDR